MIRDFLLLHKLDLLRLKNTGREALRQRPLGLVTLVAFGLGFFWGYLYLSWLLLDFVYHQDVYGVLFATRLVEFLMLIAVGMALMSSLTTSIATFYLSKDLEFQFSLPVNFNAWVLHRFGQVYFQSSWMLLLFGGAFIWIYLYLGQTPIPVQFLGVLVFAVLCSFPILLSAILCILLVVIFPARRVHQVFLVLTIVLVSSFIFLFRYIEPERFISPGGLAEFRGFIDLLSPRDQPLNPAVWAADLMAAMNQRQWQAAVGPGARLLGLFGLGMAAFLYLARRVYRSSWDRALQSLSGEGELRPSKGQVSALSRRLSNPQFSQEIREILLFFRDPSQWSQIFVLIALLGLYLFSITRVPQQLLGATAKIMSLLNGVFVGFIALSIASRFVFTSLSADGQAIWLMRTAPDGWSRFIRSKLLVFGLPCLGFSMLLGLSSAMLLGIRGDDLVQVGLAAFWDGSLMICLALALGMLFIDPMVENPLKLIVSPGGLFLMVSGLFFSLLHLALRLTTAIERMNRALLEYGWPNMQDGRHVNWTVGLIAVELVLVVWLIRRGYRHLRSGQFPG